MADPAERDRGFEKSAEGAKGLETAGENSKRVSESSPVRITTRFATRFGALNRESACSESAEPPAYRGEQFEGAHCRPPRRARDRTCRIR